MSETRLELKITENSAAAVKGLDNLASALKRVGDAINRGLKFDSLANGLEKLNTALAKGVPEQSVQRLERVASILERIQANGNVNIKITGLKGMENPVADVAKTAKSEMKAMNSALQETKTPPLFTDEIEQATAAANKATDAMSSAVRQTQSTIQQAASAEASANREVSQGVMDIANQYVNATSKAELLQMKAESLKAQLAGGIASGKFDAGKIADYSMRIQELQERAAKLAPEMNSAEKATDGFREALKRLFSTSRGGQGTLASLVSSFVRIAKMRMLRAVIRQIAEGFKLGLTNMYEYSKLVGNSFAPAMDSARNALFKMKNSLGAALAPAIQMVIPYIIQLVHWFIELVNWVNQFLALLRGQTSWTRATDAAASSMDKVKNDTQDTVKALKEAKGLLADWDELDIIQQQPTDSPSGSSSNTDKYKPIPYETMFEEVDIFDERIKKIVDWIKENFETIKAIATEVGLAILAWQVSRAFGGVLGFLAGLAAIGLVAKIVFDITTFLDNKYLETGKKGYLIANVLETALGAFIADQLMTQLVGKGAGTIAAVATLSVSATADIVALLGHTDVSALDKKSIYLAINSAAKVGAGAFLSLFKLTNIGFARSLMGGAGAAFMWASVAIGLKAILGAVDSGEITTETIQATVVSALTAGAGGFFIAKGANLTLAESAMAALAAAGLVIAVELGIEAVLADAVNTEGISPQMIFAKVMSAVAALVGTTALLSGVIKLPFKNAFLGGLAAAGLMLSVEFGISAILSTAVSTDGITSEGLFDTLIGGLTALGGTYALASGVLKWTPGKSFLLGLGVTGLYMTVALGIQAVVGTLNAKELTTKNVLAALGAAGGAGVGTAALMALGGAEWPVAAAIGAGVAIATGLTIAAAIAIALYISNKKDNIKWGDNTFPDKEIDAFVSSKMFSANAKVVIGLISDKVKISATQRANVVKKAGELFSTIYCIKLGVDDKNSLTDAHAQVDSLISSIEEYATTQTAVLKTGISVIPVLNAQGEDISAKVLQQGITGWAGVTSYMSQLGKELSNALIDSTTGELKTNWDKDVVNTLLDKVSKITIAFQSAQMSGQAQSGLASGLYGLTDMSEESFNKAIEMYTDYEKQLRENFTSIYYEEVSNFESLAAVYEAMAEAEGLDTEKGKQYSQMAIDAQNTANGLRDNLEKSIQNALDKAVAPGRKMVQDWLDDVLNGSVTTIDRQSGWLRAFDQQFRSAEGEEGIKRGLQAAVSRITGVTFNVFKVLDITGMEYLSEDVQKKIIEELKQEYGITVPLEVEVVPKPETTPDVTDEVKEIIEESVGQGVDAPEVKVPITFSAKPSENTTIQEEVEEAVEDATGDGIDMPDIDFYTDYTQVTDTPPVVLPEVDGTQFEESVQGAATAAQETVGTVTETLQSLEEVTVHAPDTSGFESGITQMADNVVQQAKRARDALMELDGMQHIYVSFGGGAGGSKYTNYSMMAEGGFVSTGEMFIARESGPEMVGRIGNRSAVANNDQLVTGIAGGVASGQAEQNALLRQQNEYLRKILAKESTVRVEPSSTWGKFNRRSEEMYARNTGRG